MRIQCLLSQRALPLSLVMVAACHRTMADTVPPPPTPPPPSAYYHFSDWFAATMISWGIPWKEPCTQTKVFGNVAAIDRKPALQCYRMGPLQHWRGFWRNGAQGSFFCRQPATRCGWDPMPDWLEFAVKAPEKFSGGGLYAVDFVGRRTAYSTDGGREGGVVVEKLNTIERLEASHPSIDDGTLK